MIIITKHSPKTKGRQVLYTDINTLIIVHICLTLGHDKIAHTTEQRENNKQPGAIYIILPLPLSTYIYINNEHFLRYLNG